MALPADSSGARPDVGHLRHLVIRVATFMAIGAIAAAVPSVGENRFIIGGILAFGVPPLIVALNFWDRQHRFEWIDVLIDVLAVVVIAQFVPNHWNILLLIGAIIVLSPASAAVEDQWKISLGAYGVLIPGMAVAGWHGGVADWELSLLCLLALVPTTLYYAKWRAEREAALRAEAAKLESLELISGGVAHDFNNILAGVVGHAEFALDGLGPDHRSRGPIESVVSAAMRAALLARQLLTFSGGQLRVRRAVALDRELRLAVSTIEPLLPAGARVELDIEAALPSVLGDADQLQQVFLNLLVNAAEASGAEATITLRAAFDHDASMVRCEVADEGSGIAPEHLQRVFDPFFSTKTRGHGLGLANVARIIESHGGEVDITSEPQVGTRFTIHLPVTAAEAPSLHAAPRQRSFSGDARTALVVDDEPEVRAVIERMLQGAGWTVLTAADGAEGLALWEQHRAAISAVLLDLKMPVMDGYACLRAIRERDRALPVLVISGFDPEGSEASAVASDARVIVVSKPFRRQELDDALTSLRASRVA